MKKSLYHIQQDIFGNFVITKVKSGEVIFVFKTKEEAQKVFDNKNLFHDAEN